jgi:hypothetical protein
MSAAAYVVVALIAAAVAATASTAIKEATSGHEDVNDAFGTWLKSFFTSFALGSASGAPGAFGWGGQAASAGADAGMYAGLSQQEINQLGAQAVTEATKQTSATAATAATTAATEAAAQSATAAMMDASGELAGTLSEPLMGQGVDVTQTIADNYSFAEPAIDSGFSWSNLSDLKVSDLLDSLSPTKNIQKLAGLTDEEIAAFSSTDISDIGSSLKSPSEIDKETFYPNVEMLARSLRFGGSLAPQQLGKTEGLRQHYKKLVDLDSQVKSTSLGSDGGFSGFNNWSYWDNSFGGNNYGY